MLPVNDEETANRVPFVSGMFMLAVMLVYAAGLFAPDGFRAAMVDNLALHPDVLFGYRTGKGVVPELLTPVTYIFLHASAIHIFGNLLFFFVFSQKAEAVFGPERFVVFIIFSAAIAGYAQAFLTVGSQTPIVGMSAVTAALMGGRLAIDPRGKFRVWLLKTLTVPAWALVAFWILPNMFGLFPGAGGGAVKTAFAAHAGGFVTGLLLAPLLAAHRAGDRHPA